MKKLLLWILLIGGISSIALVSCEKEQDIAADKEARKGGNRNNVGIPGIVSQDSLLTACGATRDSVNAGGFIFQTVQLNNLRSRHETRYSFSSTGQQYAYDIVIIEWDSTVVLPNNAVPAYSLLVSPCVTTTSCGYINGLQCAQVIYGVVGNKIYVYPGMVGFYPNPVSYTAYIGIFATPTQCNYVSQRFTFEPPHIL